MDGTSSGVHWMALGLPGGGRGEHRRPLPHASWSLSRHAPHGHSTLQQAIVALAALRLSESFPPEAVRGAWAVRHGRALMSRRQQGEPRSRCEMVSHEGPPAARREPTELSDEAEGGPLSHETERASGGYSQPHAPCARFRSRTRSNRPLVARSDAVRPHRTPAFAELLTRLQTRMSRGKDDGY